MQTHNSSDSKDKSSQTENESTPNTHNDATQEAAISRKGIYFLPSLFTTASLFSGFYAVIKAIDGEYDLAAIGILVSLVLDGIDGRVARWTNTASDFGKEYDSLVDVICFGLVPALIIYFWALNSLGKMGWLVSFIYVAATALRLARFNSISLKDNRYFHGLACPAAAVFVVTWVWSLYESGVSGEASAWLSAVVTLLMAVLMVTNVKFRSFKDLDPNNRVPFMMLGALVLFCVFIALDPALGFFLLTLAYILSGPIGWVLRRRNGGQQESVFPED